MRHAAPGSYIRAANGAALVETAKRAFALVVALGTGVCSAPPALADGFIFSVGPDGRLNSVSDDASTLRSFSPTMPRVRLIVFSLRSTAIPWGMMRPLSDVAAQPGAARRSRLP